MGSLRSCPDPCGSCWMVFSAARNRGRGVDGEGASSGVGVGREDLAQFDLERGDAPGARAHRACALAIAPGGRSNEARTGRARRPTRVSGGPPWLATFPYQREVDAPGSDPPVAGAGAGAVADVVPVATRRGLQVASSPRCGAHVVPDATGRGVEVASRPRCGADVVPDATWRGAKVRAGATFGRARAVLVVGPTAPATVGAPPSAGVSPPY